MWPCLSDGPCTDRKSFPRDMGRVTMTHIAFVGRSVTNTRTVPTSGTSGANPPVGPLLRRSSKNGLISLSAHVAAIPRTIGVPQLTFMEPLLESIHNLLV